MSVVEIAYSPNDFYYVSSGIYNDVKTICPDYLADRQNWDIKCCSDKLDKSSCATWNDVSSNCFSFELCKNKENADLINNLENNNSGAIERHRNFKQKLNNEILKTINISASIILITYLSVYFFK